MLQINEDWRLRPTEMCWILEKRTVNQETFEESWQNKAYYTLLEDALYGVCNQLLKPSRDIEELKVKLMELKKLMVVLCAKPQEEENQDLDFLE